MSKQKTVAAIVAALALATVGWNMAWRYDDAVLGSALYRERVKIRTHLITGRVEKLTSYGWVKMSYEQSYDGALAEMTTPTPAPSPSGSPTIYDQIVDAPPKQTQ